MSKAKWPPLSVSYATMQTFRGSETDERYFALNTDGWSEFGTIVNLRSTGEVNPLGLRYANRIASCWNACLSIPDPEKAIAEAKTALEKAAKVLCLFPAVKWGELISSGNYDELCSILGLNPWAVNEGRASSDTEVSCDSVVRDINEAIEQLGGPQ